MSPEQTASVAAQSQPSTLELGGLQLVLLGERAVHVPELATLLLADLHLGKGDAFRRAGIALPRGGTALDLARLDALIRSHRAERVIVLGDLIHGPLPADAHWREQWRTFLDRHAGVGFAAVLGNHDRALRGARDFEGVALLAEGHECGGLRLHHEPPTLGLPDTPVLCGHLHPVLRLRQPGLPPRVPVFWRRGNRLVLPAFSAFTGGLPLTPDERDALWLCLPAATHALPLR